MALPWLCHRETEAEKVDASFDWQKGESLSFVARHLKSVNLLTQLKHGWSRWVETLIVQ